MIIFIVLVLSVIVGFMAYARERSVVGYVILSLFISPIIVIIILACIGDRINPEQREELHIEHIRNDELTIQVNELKRMVSDVKSCPSCTKEINKEAVFCEYCGANIHELENIKQQERQQRFEEKGIHVLTDNVELMETANYLERMYGFDKVVFLKKKAKELGYGDIDLTKEDLK